VRKTTCLYDKTGDYNAAVIVKDNKGGVSKKTIKITVIPKLIITLKDEYSSDYTLNVYRNK